MARETLKKVNYRFFSAQRGFSKFPFNSLNCSFNSKDTNENVLKNRKLVKNIICLNELFFINQIHSNKVFILEDKSQFSQKKNVDGVVTKLKDIGLSILTADCSPIFLIDPNHNVIGACHAGWRGAISGIIENTIDKMITLGSLRKNIIAIIGPTIQKYSYEVGNDLALTVESTNEFKSNNQILSETSKKLFFDLPSFIKCKLFLNKINHIKDIQIDTYLNKNYFSYRRISQNRKNFNYKNITGRQVSIIGFK